MSRFQAQTNAVLDQELEDLRQHLGLEPSQKADLLREVAALAAWVVRQAEAGRTVEARWRGEVEPLVHPVIERLRTLRERTGVQRVALTDAEAERLASIFDRGFSPTRALRATLKSLASPKRRAPKLRWKKTAV